MTIKKTVQMIALSGVLAVGVSEHAIAAGKNEEWYDSRIEDAIKIGDHDSAASYLDLKNKKYGFVKEVTAVDGTTIEKTLKELAGDQRGLYAIHNGLSGVQYAFGVEDTFSMSGSAGFHNLSNTAFAMGVAFRPKDNILLQTSGSTTKSRETFGGNVSVSFGW